MYARVLERANAGDDGAWPEAARLLCDSPAKKRVAARTEDAAVRGQLAWALLARHIRKTPTVSGRDASSAVAASLAVVSAEALLSVSARDVTRLLLAVAGRLADTAHAADLGRLLDLARPRIFEGPLGSASPPVPCAGASPDCILSFATLWLRSNPSRDDIASLIGSSHVLDIVAQESHCKHTDLFCYHLRHTSDISLPALRTFYAAVPDSSHVWRHVCMLLPAANVEMLASMPSTGFSSLSCASEIVSKLARVNHGRLVAFSKVAPLSLTELVSLGVFGESLEHELCPPATASAEFEEALAKQCMRAFASWPRVRDRVPELHAIARALASLSEPRTAASRSATELVLRALLSLAPLQDEIAALARNLAETLCRHADITATTDAHRMVRSLAGAGLYDSALHLAAVALGNCPRTVAAVACLAASAGAVPQSLDISTVLGGLRELEGIPVPGISPSRRSMALLLDHLYSKSEPLRRAILVTGLELDLLDSEAWRARLALEGDKSPSLVEIRDALDCKTFAALCWNTLSPCSDVAPLVDRAAMLCGRVQSLPPALQSVLLYNADADDCMAHAPRHALAQLCSEAVAMFVRGHTSGAWQSVHARLQSLKSTKSFATSLVRAQTLFAHVFAVRLAEISGRASMADFYAASCLRHAAAFGVGDSWATALPLLCRTVSVHDLPRALLRGTPAEIGASLDLYIDRLFDSGDGQDSCRDVCSQPVVALCAIHFARWVSLAQPDRDAAVSHFARMRLPAQDMITLHMDPVRGVVYCGRSGGSEGPVFVRLRVGPPFLSKLGAEWDALLADNRASLFPPAVVACDADLRAWWDARYGLEKRMRRLVRALDSLILRPGVWGESAHGAADEDVVMNPFAPPPDASSVLLAVDAHSHAFPWEATESLAAKCVSRVLFLDVRLPRDSVAESNVAPEPQGRTSVPETVAVINPSRDLQRTEDTLVPLVSSLFDPVEVCTDGSRASQMLAAWLSTAPLVIYAGHGGGERHACPAAMLETHKRACGTMLLFGCASGRLVLRPSSAPSLAGAHATADAMLPTLVRMGAQAVLGVLWDATDRDLDRMSAAVLAAVADDRGGDAVAAALRSARAQCTLPTLNGASPVLYVRVPVHL